MLHSIDWHARAKAVSLPDHPFVDGKYIEPLSGETLSCVYPGDGRALVDVALCNQADIDLIVRSARKAFEGGTWSRMAPADRRRVLLRFSELILANREELALLETLNIGKPIADSYDGDVVRAAGCIAWYAEAIDKIYGEVAATAHDMTTLIVREPLGVVAAVVPWNYPISQAALILAPALAVGNSVILKPAEQSPFTALKLGELAIEAGVPPGVLNVVPGLGHIAGKALGLHMDVDCIGFTGSTEVGRYFMQYSGQSNIKRIGLELGGKSPQIVLADCDDLDAAASSIAAGIFTNTGQICNAGSRLIVDEKVRDKLLEKIVAQTQLFQPGDPLQPTTRMGPLVSEEQMRRVLSYIDVGRGEGAIPMIGGSRVRTETGGFYIEPTIFEGVRNDMTIAREEIFGPVLSVITVKGIDEALEVANNTIYGLAGAVWTGSVKNAHRAAKAIKAGVVWVNCFDCGSMAVPFGGFKQSGSGRDKSLHAIDKYTDLKAVWFAH
jgi:4-guanidinobutyraldehyde dehydrogenase/NAD-dependent aldehyde dehydrogenase